MQSANCTSCITEICNYCKEKYVNPGKEDLLKLFQKTEQHTKLSYQFLYHVTKDYFDVSLPKFEGDIRNSSKWFLRIREAKRIVNKKLYKKPYREVKLEELRQRYSEIINQILRERRHRHRIERPILHVIRERKKEQRRIDGLERMIQTINCHIFIQSFINTHNINLDE